MSLNLIKPQSWTIATPVLLVVILSGLALGGLILLTRWLFSAED